MDSPQLGESSRSPQQRAAMAKTEPNGQLLDQPESNVSMEQRMSRLILGNWDIPQPKRIHPSHDLISLLHLDTLYNTYVRPFADAIGPEDDGIKGGDDDGMQVDGEEHPAAGGKKRKKGKKAKLEKGYIHLIEDCIDPTPVGEHKDNLAILPLIPDQLDPGREQPAPDFGPRPMMLDSLWNNARLEAGQVVDGYIAGEKRGVKENEDKRARKRLQRQAQASAAIPTGLPSPALPSPYDRAPGTPHQAIAPPRPPFNLSISRKPFIPSRPGVPGTPSRFVPSTPGIRPPGTPGTPRIRPGSGSGVTLIPAPGSATPGGQRPLSAIPNKRPGDALSSVNSKRTKPGGGSRSASPMPHQYPYSAQTPSSGTPYQGRPGVGKQPRSKTEG